MVLDIDKFRLNTIPIIAICVSKVVLRHLWSWLSGAAQKGHLVVLLWHCHSLYFPNKAVIIFSVCWILLGRQLYGLRDFLALHILCLAYGDCCMTRTPSNSLRLSDIWRRQSRQFLGYKKKKHDDRQNQILIDFPLVMCPWSLCKGAVLENVMGFLKVIPKILKLLAENLPQ